MTALLPGAGRDIIQRVERVDFTAGLSNHGRPVQSWPATVVP